MYYYDIITIINITNIAVLFGIYVTLIAESFGSLCQGQQLGRQTYVKTFRPWQTGVQNA